MIKRLYAEIHQVQRSPINKKHIETLHKTPDDPEIQKNNTDTDNEQHPQCGKIIKIVKVFGLLTTVAVLIFSINEVMSNCNNENPQKASMAEEDLVKFTTEIPTTTPRPTTSMSFFGKTKYSFQTVSTLQASSNDSISFIDTTEFLVACRDYLVIYDLIGGTAIKHVKSDVNGNIKKLANFQNTSQHTNLLQLIQTEINNSTTESSGSATDALLWLKRGLWMMYHFFNELVQTNGTMTANEAINIAYDRTLSKHHNFFVRPIFYAALKTLPTYEKFVKSICSYKVPGDESPEESCINIEDGEVRAEVLLKEIEYYIEGLKEVLMVVDRFYADNNLPE